MKTSANFADIAVLLLISFTGHCYEVEHPVYAPTGDVAELTESVEKVMQTTDEQIRLLIQEKTDFNRVGCENCRGGAEAGRAALFEWSIDSPHQVTCSHCGHVYPSDEYPMDKTIAIVNPIGETQEYHYHQADDGRAYFWDAKIRGFIKGYFARQAKDLAVLYHLTGEQKYARQIRCDPPPVCRDLSRLAHPRL